jgi:hypothetical protein
MRARPSYAHREAARAIYVRLRADRRPYSQHVRLFLDARKCVEVILRDADYLADTFGLPRLELDAADFTRRDECATDWIDRVAVAVATWREVGVERIKERQERRVDSGHLEQPRTHST